MTRIGAAFRGVAAARRGGYALLVGVLALSGLGGAARAEDPDEVPLGTFHIQGEGVTVGEQPPGSTESQNSDTSTNQRGWFMPRYEGGIAESAARRRAVLSAAEQDLKAGRVGSAQRGLEKLIGEAPESDEAAMARKHLAELYRNASGERGKESDDVSAVRVSSDIDDQFLAEVGDRVFFSTGSAELGARAIAVIQAQARFLRRKPDLAAVIEGHADDGALADGESQKIAAARAEAVRDRLVGEGVDISRLAVVSKGRSERLAACSDPDCQAQNRRAVTVLMSALPRGVGLPARAAQAPQGPGSPQPATQ